MNVPRRTTKLVQFSGSYLNTEWTRKFILGSLLQHYNPPHAANSAGSSLAAAQRMQERATLDKELLRLQRTLTEAWSIPAQPLDKVSETRILRLLARHATGEGVMATEALDELNHVLACIRGAPQRVEEPRRMEELLLALQYARPGDNLRRVAYPGELQYPPSALAHVQTYLHEASQRDGGDPFDALRLIAPGPAFAIDSASTSEVDDAIGVYTDATTGEEYFVVYVSDATVYCPFDSPLEQLTARLLTTTTYLPEGVFFMLPKPIVEAATLREDRPCRTFDIRFQVDEATGELKNYSVGVGWLRQLRRITYDDVQALYDEERQRQEEYRRWCSGSAAHPSGTGVGRSWSVGVPSGATATPAQRPSWMTPADEKALHRIHRAAQRRYEARQSRSGERFIEANLPEALIKVTEGFRVLSVEDQVVGTRDARLAVAEMMIAANEVCSRVAQANHLSIPFRGTRELSEDHVVARSYTEPQGVAPLPSLDPHYVYFAEAMQRAIQQLRGVTRAVYFHTPIYHAGLDTHDYTHSTSPLRRYADMLVHHQLKVWLWRVSQRGGARNASLPSRRRSSVVVEQPIAEHTMATLCSMISTKQEQSSLLQDGSQRYWLLRHIEQNLLTKNRNHRFVCLVGDTRRVESAPEYPRFSTTPNPHDEYDCELPSATTGGDAQRTVPLAGRWQQRRHEYSYVSDIYIPELQLVHTVTHCLQEVAIGAVVECEVLLVRPTQGHLSLTVVKVWTGGDERQFEHLWKSALLPSLDA
ncbi:RNB domain [Trypanosoma vivax]|uniref:Putative mitochondrial exoribonuclease DSS-1 n=1 Tax=Trypanosoma vivax (strain Y486) TaxID=1055687 RepID=G0U2F7_TRYVY|nr:RNB domain [Trypanosoma vivax]CCC50460.1 putative mitochondrial exoribonuclease DSS-1 [Trypanosoma vivax Y486]